MAGQKIKTLLIEDSGFMRILISDILRSDGQIEVVSTANNGKEGVEKAKQYRPDVVVTDMLMPGHDGLYVVRTLMKEMPVPIILLSSLDRADPQVFDALKEGAVDFIDKPTEGKDGPSSERLKALVRQLANKDIEASQVSGSRNRSAHTFDHLNYDILAIGASTGGPGAIEHIINNLPENITIPVVIAQHMPMRFISAFAERLNEASGFHIKVASMNEPVRKNMVYLVPGDLNCGVFRDAHTGDPYFRAVNKIYKEYNHPSVDSLFESLAACYGARAIGVLLTGMGKDGAEGMRKMKDAGAYTIAQDEGSSVVYGMPKAAVEAKAARQVLSLKEMPGFIVSCLS